MSRAAARERQKSATQIGVESNRFEVEVVEHCHARLPACEIEFVDVWRRENHSCRPGTGC